ncbi:MAG: methyltransferase domain-containing protein [Acidobacteriota bacterium]
MKETIQKKPGLKSLQPGITHRFSSRYEVTISFLRENQPLQYQLTPGEIYSFRKNETGVLELYYLFSGREDVVDLGPYLSTPGIVVKKMFEIAGLNKNDLLYDLGSGDGRIVVMAASIHGIRAKGIEIDPERIIESKELAKKAKVSHLVKFILQDLTVADFSDATVVTLYLPERANTYIRPQLERQLKEGTRVVCHDYQIPGWENRIIRTLNVMDEKKEKHHIYLYRR